MYFRKSAAQQNCCTVKFKTWKKNVIYSLNITLRNTFYCTVVKCSCHNFKLNRTLIFTGCHEDHLNFCVYSVMIKRLWSYTGNSVCIMQIIGPYVPQFVAVWFLLLQLKCVLCAWKVTLPRFLVLYRRMLTPQRSANSSDGGARLLQDPLHCNGFKQT